MNATIVDLRYRMEEVLRAIGRGESVIVLYRGKEKAKLTPIIPATPSPSRTRDQPLFGLWKDRKDMSDPGSYLRRLRLPRVAMPKDSTQKRKQSPKPK